MPMHVKTFFAEPEKNSEEELATEIDLVSKNTLVSGLLHTVSGILAVVNERRQVVAFNDSFMKMLGIENPREHLGLRPGEIVECIHADEAPAGCGTTKYCRTCGAAVAMVTCLAEQQPVERMCVLQAVRGDREIDIALNVRAQPIEIDGRRFLLLFLQDITKAQQLAALERSFFHDVNNLMTMLVGASELLTQQEGNELAHTVLAAVKRLSDEISIQQYLSENQLESYSPMWCITTPKALFDEIVPFFERHPIGKDKEIVFLSRNDTTSIRTDHSITLRILCNMVINALEATEPYDQVRVWVETTDTSLAFSVWNGSVIPEDNQHRIFQRNFSTKKDSGRGIGTFSMKLLGEKVLGGKVDFTSSEEEGTTFSFSLPF